MSHKGLDLAKFKDAEYCYLTTTGRKSGKPHEIEIWFGINANSLYLLSGGGDDSDWVKNLRLNPNVTVRIAKHTFTGTARIVRNIEEESLARPMLAAKYQSWHEGQKLSDWARDALVVAIDFSPSPSLPKSHI
jgi:deazaflavin-dependent oxidoreductase (nitroreductase family)